MLLTNRTLSWRLF